MNRQAVCGTDLGRVAFLVAGGNQICQVDAFTDVLRTCRCGARAKGCHLN